MARGRKPVPTAKHKLRGSYRADRHGNRLDATIEPGAMTPPDWLTGDARAYWPELAAMLEGLGIGAPVYSTGLALLCDALALYVRMRDAVDGTKGKPGTGEYCTTDKGNVVPHPAAAARNAAWERVRKMLVEFGMTPAAAARITPNAGATDAGHRKVRFFDQGPKRIDDYRLG